MTNRKKRLKKGIESIHEQIEIHHKKKQKAEEEGDEDLIRYYIKEIEAKEKAMKEKQALLDKQ